VDTVGGKACASRVVRIQQFLEELGTLAFAVGVKKRKSRREKKTRAEKVAKEGKKPVVSVAGG